MSIELKVPSVGESITEVQIGEWLKAEGERVARDEVLVTIDTDKVTVELSAPAAGVLSAIKVKSGEEAAVGDVIGYIEASEVAGVERAGVASHPPTPGPVAPAPSPSRSPTRSDQGSAPFVMPAAARALSDHGLSTGDVTPTGPGGRLLKEDVERHARHTPLASPVPAVPAEERARLPAVREREALELEARPAAPAPPVRAPVGVREERPVRMSILRRRIAERLVESQQTAALLTTFNEIDMTEVLSLRKRYQDTFSEKYGIKLGLMSFFVKAAVEALRLVPEVNAEIRDKDIVYKSYYDVGIAVGGGKGLVVPVIRNAEQLGFAEIERQIVDFAARAKSNELKLEELEGGTFTVSNGGIYGSLLSTPIINPPQSGILGLHAIQDRPVARGGQVVVLPMMYVALTYDHRLIDGRESVRFLKRIKECVEHPERILLDI